MRGRKTDNQVLDTALTQVEQGPDFVPEQFEKSLLALSPEELEQLFIQGCNIASLVMAEKGWILLVLKRKVGHGNFKARLAQLDVNYAYANYCMNVARAVGKFPELAKIPDQKILRQITHLPDDKQAEIAEAVKVLPKKGLYDKPLYKHDQWRELRPWVLNSIGFAFAKKKPGPTKNLKDVPLPEITPLDDLYRAALKALRQIADLEITEPEYAKADKYALELIRAWNGACYNLTDPAHVKPPIWEVFPDATDREAAE